MQTFAAADDGHGLTFDSTPPSLLLGGLVGRVLIGEIPSFKLFESERVFAFLDIQPLSRGHAVCMAFFVFFFLLVFGSWV